MPYIEWPLATLEGELTSLSKELLQLQEEMNTALEELLEVRASMDCCCRELDLGAELAACIIMMPSSPKPRHAMQLAATALQWAHLDSISALNCKVMAEEGQKCQAFAKKFSVALLSLPTRGPLGTHIPPTTLDQQHSPSPPLRDASHSPTTGHDRHRVHPSTSHLEHIRILQCLNPLALNDGAIPPIKACLTQGKMKRKLLMTHA